MGSPRSGGQSFQLSRFAVVGATSGLFRFSGPFQRTSRHFVNSIGYYIL